MNENGDSNPLAQKMTGYKNFNLKTTVFKTTVITSPGLDLYAYVTITSETTVFTSHRVINWMTFTCSWLLWVMNTLVEVQKQKFCHKTTILTFTFGNFVEKLLISAATWSIWKKLSAEGRIHNTISCINEIHVQEVMNLFIDWGQSKPEIKKDFIK